MVERFAEEAPFSIRLLRIDTNQGFAQNFARAIEASTGDIPFLSVQDDYWLPYRIVRMLQALVDDAGTSLVVCNLMLTDQRLNPSGVTHPERLRATGKPDSALTTGCATAFRAWFKRVGYPIPDGLSRDGFLHRLLSTFGRKFVIREPLMLFRRHNDNASGCFTRLTQRIRLPAPSSTSLRLARRATIAERDGLVRASNEGLSLLVPLPMIEARIAAEVAGLDARIRMVEAPIVNRVRLAARILQRGTYDVQGRLRALLRDFAGAFRS